MFKIYFFVAIMFSCIYSYAQTTSVDTAIFTRIMSEMKTFKPDTSAVADDAVTKKVTELRSLRGGFNINEAISFKLAEDSSKGEITKQEYTTLSAYFIGQGGKWLDNAIVRIYRQHFTEAELDELIRFYKTSAGQKLATDFPIIMLQSIAAGEMVKTAFPQQNSATQKGRK